MQYELVKALGLFQSCTRSCVVFVFLIGDVLSATDQLLYDVIAIELGRIMNRGKPIHIQLIQLVDLTPTKEVVDVCIHCINTVVPGSLQKLQNKDKNHLLRTSQSKEREGGGSHWGNMITKICV